MKKVRYRPAETLGPVATTAQIQVLRQALQAGQVSIERTANRYLTRVWHMSTDQFLDAVRSHLHEGCRFFQKCKKGTSELLPNKLEASIWIREPDEDDDHDDGTVYVEFILRNQDVVIIFDAHEHEAGIQRLPP